MAPGDFISYASYHNPPRQFMFFRGVVVSVLVLLMVGYISYQARDVFVHPVLELDTPTNGAVLTSKDITIEGTASVGVDLTINGAKVYSDQHGHFTHNMLLARGLHVIEIIAKNRFGRETRIVRQVVIE